MERSCPSASDVSAMPGATTSGRSMIDIGQGGAGQQRGTQKDEKHFPLLGLEYAMARLFLVNPSTDETVRSPLLSFLYLAATLRRAGHEIALLDCSAPFAPKEQAEIVD